MYRRGLVVLLAVLALAGRYHTARALPATVDLSGLHVSSNQLLNGAGQVVNLRGVNRSSFEFDCEHVDWGIYHEGGADQTEVNKLLSYGINAVRMNLNEDCWLGVNIPDGAGAVKYDKYAFQADFARYVNLLSSNNLAVIIELVYNAPSTILAGGNTGLQYPLPDADHSPEMWRSVALTFMGNSRVIFEPFNEPYPDFDHQGATSTTAAWLCWRDGGSTASCPSLTHSPSIPNYTAAGMQTLVNAIRGVYATNPILLSGTNWSSDNSQWITYKPTDTLSPEQFIIGMHSYGDGLSCQNLTCWNATTAPNIAAYPFIADEIGELDCAHTYLASFIAFLEAHSASYLVHAYDPYACAGGPSLLSNWDGTPATGYGDWYFSHLQGYAPPAALTAPAAGSTLPGSTVTFTWGAVGGADYYALFIGTTSGGNQLAAVYTAGTSRTVRGLPRNSSTVYATLWTHTGGGWSAATPVTYTAAGAG